MYSAGYFAQQIQRQPATINTVTAIISRDGHWLDHAFPPPKHILHPSCQRVIMPEFSAYSNLRDCNRASALATNTSGTVLLGIKVQHVVTITCCDFDLEVESRNWEGSNFQIYICSMVTLTNSIFQLPNRHMFNGDTLTKIPNWAV